VLLVLLIVVAFWVMFMVVTSRRVFGKAASPIGPWNP
jgi:hypothetical protein